MQYFWKLLFALISTGLFAQANFSELDLGEQIPIAEDTRGVSIADYDNDGDQDILFLANPVKLLRNDGNLVFTQVTNSAGLTNLKAKMAVWFDANNDGWLDIIFASWEGTALYLSDQDGTFSFAGDFEVKNREAIVVGDLNGDQWPDMHMPNFLEKNDTYFNEGEGHFSGSVDDITEYRRSMGSLMFDFDEDGDLDIYITYDGDPNELLLNDGQAQFEERSKEFSLDNKTFAMGVDIADFNLDGKYDFYIANLYHNSLLLQQPDGTYQDIAEQSGTDDNGMGWGTVCFDYNNDGYNDIYVNNEYNSYPNQLYRNNKDLTFTDVAPATVLENYMGGYGCAAGDLNNDGRPDLAIVNWTGEKNLRIFINEEENTGNWLQVSLVGKTSNKFALGARLRAYKDGSVYMQDVKAGIGYRSQNPYRQHFGLGSIDMLDSLIIYWPDGLKDKHLNISTNVHYLAVQGEPLSEYETVLQDQFLSEPGNLPVPLLVEPSNGPDLEFISIARAWNEQLLEAIRGDFARPTVHARNLFHISLAMYDAWAAYDTVASTIFLGNGLGDFNVDFEGIPEVPNINSAREQAISYAAYRLLTHRFAQSPSSSETLGNAFKFMRTLGYEPDFLDDDYTSGNPAALGNYIANKLIEFGLQDGSNEENGYANLYYSPVNSPLKPHEPGNPDITDPNRWQQLELLVAIDQSGNPVNKVQDFLSPEWGNVVPFSLTEDDLTIYTRDGNEYWVYHDPGGPPQIDPLNNEASEEYKWNFELVAKWSGQLDANLDEMVDISPASIGNLSDDDFPDTFEEYQAFYAFEGADSGPGYESNPVIGIEYEPQIVRKGDYARVLAEFWADGPDSETPPGHWFTILNYVTDHPAFLRKFMGEEDKMDLLEWDVKSYLALGGAMHDVAISSWGIKGYYDYIRPINAIRYMSDQGQANLPGDLNYDPAGIRLEDGKIELVRDGDPLAGDNGENIGKIKVKSWKGPVYINDPDTDVAGVDWIFAENWWPYQRPSFVTPPFAGYISGHSTYSRAAAEVLTLLTGDEYFPDGLGEFHAGQNEFLVFEDGPSTDVVLQWAKYRDASDQCSLSRIWGGIHPPADDIPGRKIGVEIGHKAFQKALAYFNGENIVTGVEDEPSGLSLLYPNPATQYAYIEGIDWHSSPVIRVFSLQGKEVEISWKQETRRAKLNLSTLKSGLYFVQVGQGVKGQTFRVILN